VWPNISGIHKNECTKVQTTYPKVNIQTTYPKVYIIPSSQVQYIKTSPRVAHGNWDPDDAPAGDAPTCDPSDPPTWFDDAPECRWIKRNCTWTR
jgi:hypothetical protein